MSENVSDTAAGRQREERGCGWSPGSSREQQGEEGGSKGGASRSANYLHPPDCASSRRADIPLTVGLQPEFKRQLEAKAKRLGISVSELIGRILRADIEHDTKYLCWIFAVFVTFCSVCSAESYTGTITRVIDGDTIVMASDSSHKPSTIL